jgi:hypothetical protein
MWSRRRGLSGTFESMKIFKIVAVREKEGPK